jgi:predicted dinucleotide-utilizing enzyme
MRLILLPIILFISACASIIPLPNSHLVFFVREAILITDCEYKGRVHSDEGMKWVQSELGAIETDLRNQATKLNANTVYLNGYYVNRGLAYKCKRF